MDASESLTIMLNEARELESRRLTGLLGEYLHEGPIIRIYGNHPGRDYLWWHPEDASLLGRAETLVHEVFHYFNLTGTSFGLYLFFLEFLKRAMVKSIASLDRCASDRPTFVVDVLRDVTDKGVRLLSPEDPDFGDAARHPIEYFAYLILCASRVRAALLSASSLSWRELSLALPNVNGNLSFYVGAIPAFFPGVSDDETDIEPTVVGPSMRQRGKLSEVHFRHITVDGIGVLESYARYNEFLHFSCLQLGRAELDDSWRQAGLEWLEKYEATPRYYEIAQLCHSAVLWALGLPDDPESVVNMIDDGSYENVRFTTLALLELALMPQLLVPTDESAQIHWTDFHPGWRLLKCLQALPSVGWLDVITIVRGCDPGYFRSGPKEVWDYLDRLADACGWMRYRDVVRQVAELRSGTLLADTVSPDLGLRLDLFSKLHSSVKTNPVNVFPGYIGTKLMDENMLPLIVYDDTTRAFGLDDSKRNRFANECLRSYVEHLLCDAIVHEDDFKDVDAFVHEVVEDPAKAEAILAEYKRALRWTEDDKEIFRLTAESHKRSDAESTR